MQFAGTFEISGLRPGSYWAFARAFGNEAKAAVDIVGKDVDDVSISFVTGFDVPLKIVVEGDRGPVPCQSRDRQFRTQPGNE
jgi:hypothetical protein